MAETAQEEFWLVIHFRTLRLAGNVPPEVWDRLGTNILPKLRSGTDLRIGVDFSVMISAALVPGGGLNSLHEFTNNLVIPLPI
jgi:hypothetical protein